MPGARDVGGEWGAAELARDLDVPHEVGRQELLGSLPGARARLVPAVVPEAADDLEGGVLPGVMDGAPMALGGLAVLGRLGSDLGAAADCATPDSDGRQLVPVGSAVASAVGARGELHDPRNVSRDDVGMRGSGIGGRWGRWHGKPGGVWTRPFVCIRGLSALMLLCVRVRGELVRRWCWARGDRVWGGDL
jgi:hypothetical protein